MAIVAEGERGPVYLTPTAEHEAVAREARPNWKPDTPLHGKCRVSVPNYGFNTFGELFTPRQLVALSTFSDLIGEAMERIRTDARAAGFSDDTPLHKGGTGAGAYAEAVGVYLAMGVSRLSDILNSLCSWEISKTQVRHLFTKQAIPMLWDFGENNPFGSAAGGYLVSLNNLLKVFTILPGNSETFVSQIDAATQKISFDKLISTDPPYYDNICYSDLSDFFYIWLRRSLQNVFPCLFATLAVPKAEELIASPYRHGSKQKAEAFFLNGMTQAMHRLAEQAHPAFPATIYYTFKQSEKKDESGAASSGWETFLDAVIKAGFGISGTWPMCTELGNRMIGSGTNALASSIVLVCRPRPNCAPTATRREFQRRLREEMPEALEAMIGSATDQTPIGGFGAGGHRPRHGDIFPISSRIEPGWPRNERARCAGLDQPRN